MKKIICLIVVLSNIFSMIITVNSTQLSETAKNDLYNYGIMTGDPNGDLRLEDNITRAEFCKMICVTLGYKDMQLSVIEDFYDVNTEHWAYHYIQTARGLGLIEGVDGRYFNPNQNIIVYDIVKTVVTALGYKAKAEEKGYFEIAEEIGLIKKDDFEMKRYATREQVAYLISDCLDIPLLHQTSFGKNPQYTVMDGTNNTPLITLRTKLK